MAEQARTDADAAHLVAASSEQQSVELRRQLDELQARPTDRGLVLTLGDVLFTSGRADLKTGATGNLDRLVAFLNQYPDRTIAIEATPTVSAVRTTTRGSLSGARTP
jgi:outer membrane protein OmpA-like peptidoglycan-associated protein